MIGKLISDIGLEKMNLQNTKRIKHGEISHGDLVKMAVMLLANGRTDFADIDLYRDDPLFKEVLDIRKVASAATFRQRLNDLAACNADQTLLNPMIVNLLRKVKDFGRIHTETAQYVPLDVDVSVMLQPNCNKENVSLTYHNAPGYAPIFAYLGTFGYMLGIPCAAGRIHDILCAMKLLASHGVKEIGLVANGQGVIPAALAALYFRDCKVTTQWIDPPQSFESLMEMDIVPLPHSSLITGILKYLDLPELFEKLKGKAS